MQARNAYYYLCNGWRVNEREYGTRVYREMFTLLTNDDVPLIEVRRNPASQGLNGIHMPNECHIRLVNRSCYFDDAANFLKRFLDDNGYYDVRISRIDICLDFSTFDRGDDPAAFVRRYFRHKYAKINQGNITGHGKDGWSGQDWNSLSWGSPHSDISTKLYNKTLELYDKKTNSFRKPYIRQAWHLAGLVDNWQNCTKNGELVNVWRVEFSIKSPRLGWVEIDIDGKPRNKQSLKNTLDTYASREKLLMMFASLAQHYFRFKYWDANKRKDRCEDKVLFVWHDVEQFYKIGSDKEVAGTGDNSYKRTNRLILLLEQYKATHATASILQACKVLIASMQEDNVRADMRTPWSVEEFKQMKYLLNLRLNDKSLTWEAAMNIVRKEMGITDRTIGQFVDEPL